MFLKVPSLKAFIKIFFNVLVLFLLLLTVACNDQDNALFNGQGEVQTDAKKENLAGIWSIYKVENDGNESNVLVNFQECGRDFFMYNDTGFYEEFLFQESFRCQPTKNQLKWNLSAGIITLTSIDNTASEIIKIKSLDKNVFIFSVNLDLNGDAVKEMYTFTALKYLPPNETDIYTSSFQRKVEEPFIHHIEFGWDAYNGYRTFVKYELFRSGSACNLDDAELIKTITDININTFIDENPLISAACYFLKIYTDKGLLGESDPRYINPEFIYPQNVVLKNAEVNNNEITLSWEQYSGYYFSHYEIKVQNQNNNSSPFIERVKIITDINTTSFIDANPPYVNNPVYSISVHNKFGNESSLPQGINMLQANFIRPEILNFDFIKYVNFDAESQSFFFYGKTAGNTYRLLKYNYKDKKVTAEAFKIPTSQAETEMKLITSENGKELIFSQVGELWVYNAEDLTFKYSLNAHYSYVQSFDYLDDDIWVFSDQDDVFTFKRDQDNFAKIDEKPHFTMHQGSMNYEITTIDKNNILVSHNNEGRAIQYAISNNGEITNNGVKEIPLKFKYNSDVQVNSFSNLILNKMRNTVYSSLDFSELLRYSIPKTTLNFNKLGTKIYGTNNEVSYINPDQKHKKELVIYDIQNKTISYLATKGYPMFVMEDDFGNIVSLSSGFPRDNYYDFQNGNTLDIFVEIVK